MVTTIQMIEGLSKRLEKVRQILADGKVHPVIGMDSHYCVAASDGQGFYMVNGECTCPDANQRTELHNGWCKHNLAVELFKENQPQTEEKGTETSTEDAKDSLYGPESW